MRTLDSMKEIKKLKLHQKHHTLCSFSSNLGLYTIKTELEDLSFKFTYPNEYDVIKNKLEKTKAVRDRYIQSLVIR